MPAKYVIHSKPAQGRFRPVGKLGIVNWREDCSSCHNCVKRGCIYGFYRDEADTLRDEIGYLDYIYQCKGCLNCVQDSTRTSSPAWSIPSSSGWATRITRPRLSSRRGSRPRLGRFGIGLRLRRPLQRAGI